MSETQQGLYPHLSVEVAVEVPEEQQRRVEDEIVGGDLLAVTVGVMRTAPTGFEVQIGEDVVKIRFVPDLHLDATDSVLLKFDFEDPWIHSLEACETPRFPLYYRPSWPAGSHHWPDSRRANLCSCPSSTQVSSAPVMRKLAPERLRTMLRVQY